MDLPKIDLSFLPDLGSLVGLFGSGNAQAGHDDRIVILMTYLYEVFPPTGLI